MHCISGFILHESATSSASSLRFPTSASACRARIRHVLANLNPRSKIQNATLHGFIDVSMYWNSNSIIMYVRYLDYLYVLHQNIKWKIRVSYCIIAFSIMVRTMNWLMFVILLIFDLQLRPERSCRSCTVDATQNRLNAPNVEVVISYLATGKTTRHSHKHAVSGHETCSSTPREAGIYIAYYIVTYDSKDKAWSLVYYHI